MKSLPFLAAAIALAAAPAQIASAALVRVAAAQTLGIVCEGSPAMPAMAGSQAKLPLGCQMIQQFSSDTATAAYLIDPSQLIELLPGGPEAAAARPGADDAFCGASSALTGSHNMTGGIMDIIGGYSGDSDVLTIDSAANDYFVRNIRDTIRLATPGSAVLGAGEAPNYMFLNVPAARLVDSLAPDNGVPLREMCLGAHQAVLPNGGWLGFARRPGSIKVHPGPVQGGAVHLESAAALLLLAAACAVLARLALSGGR